MMSINDGAGIASVMAICGRIPPAGVAARRGSVLATGFVNADRAGTKFPTVAFGWLQGLAKPHTLYYNP